MSGILVVCTGNVCRSPMAEGFLRAALAERMGREAPAVSSAGTSGWEGSGATEESVRSARDLGVDISSHVARALSAPMIDEADLVLCMAADHRGAVVRTSPDATDKTFTIKELVWLLEGSTGGSFAERVAAAAAGRNGLRHVDEDVRDPLGDPIEGYREVADELHDLSGRLAVALTEGPGLMRIAMGSDHAGFTLKEDLKAFLAEEGHEVRDHGTDSTEVVDYPPFCAAAARAVATGEADRAIVLGGSGQGEQIAANKVDGVRAALCHDLYLARLSRGHNDANVLAMGARVIAPAYAREIVRVWLDTPFEGGRHLPRLDQIAQIERGEL